MIRTGGGEAMRRHLFQSWWEKYVQDIEHKKRCAESLYVTLQTTKAGTHSLIGSGSLVRRLSVFATSNIDVDNTDLPKTGCIQHPYHIDESHMR